jgi:hypothetical protein
MFKKTIEFEDFNGKKQRQDFYFHMSKSELLTIAADGSAYTDHIKRIVELSDGAAILHEFRQLVSKACGVRSADGARFIKDAEAKSQLMDSPAFDELLMELATNADDASNFVQQLIPEKMQKELKEQLLKQDDSPVDPFADKPDNRPAYQKEHRLPTEDELRAMNKDEMQEAFRIRMGPKPQQ